MIIIAHVFKRSNTYTHLISSAISEGIKDTFKEMGYKYDKGSANEKKEYESGIESSEMIILKAQKN
jgi:hypothetical protein